MLPIWTALSIQHVEYPVLTFTSLENESQNAIAVYHIPALFALIST